MKEIVLMCQDSLEGIFTGIYEAYRRKLDHGSVYIEVAETDLRLFADYIVIEPEPDKAVKVIRTLQTQFGEEDLQALCFALATEDEEKAQAVYRTIVWGLGDSRKNKAGRLLDHLADDYVRKVMELNRRTNNEVHHLKGFLRFQELEQGILYAKIGPKNNVLPLLTPHFADRMPMESFVIYDDVREVFALHPAGQEWYLVTGAHEEEQNEKVLAYSKEEQVYQELFKHFCHKIGIKERRNLQLQRNMLPLRFQKYMVEFTDNN